MSVGIDSDVASGLRAVIDAGLEVATWSPHAVRAGDAFDELYATLRPQIDALLGEYEVQRSVLIPLAQLFQDHEGYVSANAIAAISYLVGETRASVESTVSFYTLLYRRPIGKYMVQVCRNLSCVLNGAEGLMEHARRTLGIGHLETTADGMFSYEEVECLAACDRAPCAQVNLEYVYDLTPAKVDALVASLGDGTSGITPLAQTRKPSRSWKVDPDSGAKSRGAMGVLDPNNAGGIGDASGRTMFDLIVGRPEYEQRSNERLLRETTLRVEPSENVH